MKIYDDMMKLIGRTPLVWISPEINDDCNWRFAGKLEMFNPSGSVKDRPAFSMLDNAIKRGLVDNGTIIIEPTSGNTGIGLAMCCAILGLELILTMPESMSLERRKLLKAYGAKLVLTPKELGMQGAVDEAKRLHCEYSNSFIPSQFENPDNPLVHENTTAVEIYDDTEGKVDMVVGGIGTGGTITGIGRKLKSLNPAIKIVGVEPFESPLITKGTASPHKIQGIGANFVPKNLDLAVVDEVVTVKGDDAIDMARFLAQKNGILCGISAGAAAKAAMDLAKMPENEDKIIVAILCDSGERYLSTELFK